MHVTSGDPGAQAPMVTGHFIGCLRTLDGEALGTAFLILENRVATCFHVVRDEVANGSRAFVIDWPAPEGRMHVELTKWNETSDIAILQFDEAKPPGLTVPVARAFLAPNTEFQTFGYRHAEEFGGLHGVGTILGETSRPSQHQDVRLLQLRSKEIGAGMSGAPIWMRERGSVVILGMVAGRFLPEGQVDAETAFALPIDSVLREAREEVRAQRPAQRSILEMNVEDRLSTLLIAAALLLFADRFVDGAWGRTLWRVGGDRLTQDVDQTADADQPGPRKAISVSSWAGQALAKSVGRHMRDILAETKAYVLKYYNDTQGAFGFVHHKPSDTPLVRRGREFVGNPRHTASAIKMLQQLEGMSRVVGHGLHFVLQSQLRDGSWGEGIASRGNTLSTAYVLDTLLLLHDDVTFLHDVIDAKRYRYIDSRFEDAIADGLEWLRTEQEDGGWGYRAEYPEVKPFYTAHIVCFLPQLLQRYPDACDATEIYIRKNLVDGGFPEEIGGPPKIAATAMVVYGLWRTDRERFRDIVEGGLRFLAAQVPPVASRFPEMNVLDSTFTLLLGQRPEFCSLSWQEKAGAAIVAHRNAMKDHPDDVDAVASATVDALDESLSGLRDALVDVMCASADDE